jgi:hypothetical protein
MNSKDREQVIQAAWRERGRDEWEPDTHGKGLLPLNIQAEIRMSPTGPLGTPIPPYDGLEFRLEQSNVDGQTLSAIVCEGVIVEPVVSRDEAANSWLSARKCGEG